MKKIISLAMSAVIAATMLVMPSAAASKEWKTASEVVSEIKCGWNLANCMELYNPDNSQFDSRYKDFKLVCTYFTSPYDNVWNPSPICDFNTKGEAELVWETSSIESDSKLDYGCFSIAVWNNELKDKVKLNVEITKAIYVTDTGKSYDLNNAVGKYNTSVSNGLSGELCLTGVDIFKKTADVKKGTIKINAKITNIDDAVAAYSKEQYYEYLWGSEALASEGLIDKIREKGFSAVRIPVTYTNFTDPETFAVDEERLARLEELAGYVLDRGITVLSMLTATAEMAVG